MKRIVLLTLMAVWLSGCAALALTPEPAQRVAPKATSSAQDAFNPPALPIAGALPGEVTSPPATPTTSISITPTLTLTSTLTLTPTLSATNTLVISPTVIPPLANRVGPIVDLGFRPMPDGYVFRNYGGVTYGDYTIADMRGMFGNSAVCFNPKVSNCAPKLAAVQWNRRANFLMNNGHCDGITITSLRLFKSQDQPSAFSAAATQTYSLPLTTIRRQIAYYWTLQIPKPVAQAQYQSILQTPSQILQQLYAAMYGAAPDPTSLLVYNSQHTAGHSLLPYAIDSLGGGVYHVRVYDSNWPTDANRFVIITTTINAWSYNLGNFNASRTATTWSGDAGTYSLGAVPISTYTQPPVCPWCAPGTSGNTTNAASILAWNDGDSQMLVTDSRGRRLGSVNGRSVTEIPQAFRSILPGGLGLADTPIDYLPVTDTYTLTISSPSSVISQSHTVDEFGPNYAIAVSDIHLSGGHASQIAIANDGQQLNFRSATLDQLTFDMIVESDQASQQFQVSGLPIGSGRGVTLTIDAAREQFVLNNSQNISGTYDFSFTRLTDAGQQVFTATNVVITATDTQSLNYGAWNGTGPITLTVDSGSAGTTIHTIALSNRSNTFFLPLVLNQG